MPPPFKIISDTAATDKNASDSSGTKAAPPALSKLARISFSTSAMFSGNDFKCTPPKSCFSISFIFDSWFSATS